MRRLVVCDCSEMDVDEFVAIGKLTTLTELRCGGIGEGLAPFAGDVKAAIGRGWWRRTFTRASSTRSRSRFSISCRLVRR